MHRRNFFKSSAITGVSMAVAAPLLSSFTEGKKADTHEPRKPQIAAPRGAVYVPARAFNTWQQWKDYDHKVTERDFGYAASINLNCLRIWLCYEYWRANPRRHEACLEQMLQAADKKGMKVLLALFDSCGVENTPEAREDRDPRTAVAVKSPGSDVCMDVHQWGKPAEFVQRIMKLHGDDDRLLAIEVFNEPTFEHKRIAIARFLFKTAKEKQSHIPLTIGSLKGMQNWGNFMDLGIDILQYHDNYPTDLDGFKKELHMAKQVAGTLNRPLWLTEWERLRPAGSGWNEAKIPIDQLGPDYASLAGAVHASGIGNCFWSLMLKPAYLRPQRNIGGFNGLFHEDGAVYSLADARAISGNPHFQAPERRELPGWLQASH